VESLIQQSEAKSKLSGAWSQTIQKRPGKVGNTNGREVEKRTNSFKCGKARSPRKLTAFGRAMLWSEVSANADFSMRDGISAWNTGAVHVDGREMSAGFSHLSARKLFHESLPTKIGTIGINVLHELTIITVDVSIWSVQQRKPCLI
jgi:hypothetical protein